MEISYYDGLIDNISGKTYSHFYQNSEVNMYRVKLKQGINTLNWVFNGRSIQNALWAVDFGLNNGLDRNPVSGSNCGQYATFYFKPAALLSIRLYDGWLSEFLSQFEIVYDYIPDIFYTSEAQNIVIDSVDFESKVGLFDFIPDRKLTFQGSTFIIGPQIFSDKVMRETPVYPTARLINALTHQLWEPFKNCPNLQSINFQGEFGEMLNEIFPCDLTFYDSDGYGKLSAYPSGGNPITIDKYINADKIRFSEKFPEIGSERLLYAYSPFVIDTVVISTYNGSFPFGGIDYHGRDMITLELSDVKFEVFLPLQEGRDVMFSWASLGIFAPNSCNNVTNLYRVYSYATPDADFMNIATVDFLETYEPGWARALKDIIERHPDSIHNDLMPMLTDGLEIVKGYYEKVTNDPLEGEYDEDTGEPILYFKSNIRGVNGPYVFDVQKLPNTVHTLHYYCKNLYANSILFGNIHFPAIPESVVYMIDAYAQTFRNTFGNVEEVETFETPDYNVSLITQRSNRIGEYRVNLNIDGATNQSYDGFAEDFQDAAGDLGLLVFGVPCFNIKDVVDVFAGNKEIKKKSYPIYSNVTFENQVFLNLRWSTGFQRECYLNSWLDPTINDLLVPIQGNKEWDNYNRTFLFAVPEYTEDNPDKFYGGRIVRGNNSVAYMFVRTTDAIDTSVGIDSRYKLGEIIYSGTPKTIDSNTCIRPYRHFADKGSIVEDIPLSDWLIQTENDPLIGSTFYASYNYNDNRHRSSVFGFNSFLTGVNPNIIVSFSSLYSPHFGDNRLIRIPVDEQLYPIPNYDMAEGAWIDGAAIAKWNTNSFWRMTENNKNNILQIIHNILN